jgi:hypothetical protein
MANIIGTVAISVGVGSDYGLVVRSDKCPRGFDECLGASHREDGTHRCWNLEGVDTVNYSVIIHCLGAEQDDLQP